MSFKAEENNKELSEHILVCLSAAPSYHIAGKLHLSAAYFNDLLKFETGKTWEEYVQFKQLEKAKHLLQKNDNSPIAVAKQLGYPNVQYFSFIFKKVTGCTPNDYRHSQN